LLWHAEFLASYIESITSKTGSFKRFPVLVKMLLTAMRHQTDSVALDLLTYADLVRGVWWGR
jgi:coiled-coil domain-containing protein 61